MQSYETSWFIKYPERIAHIGIRFSLELVAHILLFWLIDITGTKTNFVYYRTKYDQILLQRIDIDWQKM